MAQQHLKRICYKDLLRYISAQVDVGHFSAARQDPESKQAVSIRKASSMLRAEL